MSYGNRDRESLSPRINLYYYYPSACAHRHDQWVGVIRTCLS